MLTAGYSYRLKIERIDTRGAWLEADGEELLLPELECPDNATAGDEVEVFIYLERGNTRRATSQMPLVQVGEFALLQVKSVGPHGAFLEWGLGKDLLCPHSEQPQPLLEGRRYPVYVYLDREGRPTASARLEKFLLRENEDLQEGDEVELMIWAFTDLGAKVIVNNRYEALLYRDEVPAGLKRGDRTTGYVLRIRPDQRIDISLRRPGAAGVTDAREVLLAALKEEGVLPLHDQSSPEEIREQLGLSKKVFKKAVGGLYKDGVIVLVDGGIKLK